jgi:beta-lactam-binding protein with PASTA domain
MEVNIDNIDKIEKREKRKRIIKFTGRLVVILFLGLSLFLFVSAVILIFLTKPDKEVAVPNVTGKRFVDVYNSLVRKGLVPVVKTYDVYDMDNDVILNQYPEKGAIVTEGEKINLVVSKSRVFLPVPNLMGTKLPFALNKLKSLHFNDRSYSIQTGVISYIQSDTAAESIVIGQSPEAGEEISPDRLINLLVSAGKIQSDMKMPELRGQSIDLCIDLLLSKGLFVSEEILLTDSTAYSGIIESQTPKQGEAIERGSLVKLKIYYYPQREKTYTSYERITFEIPRDEKPGLYEAYIEDNKQKRIVFSNKMKPGWKMDFVFKRKGEATVTITNNKEVIEEIDIEPDDFD